MSFRYRLRVRYSECDAQKIVYNARYAEYVDLAATEFLRAVWGDAMFGGGFDYRLVRQVIEWRQRKRAIPTTYAPGSPPAPACSSITPARMPRHAAPRATAPNNPSENLAARSTPARERTDRCPTPSPPPYGVRPGRPIYVIA